MLTSVAVMPFLRKAKSGREVVNPTTGPTYLTENPKVFTTTLGR
jgi:hypothetical protein